MTPNLKPSARPSAAGWDTANNSLRTGNGSAVVKKSRNASCHVTGGEDGDERDQSEEELVAFKGPNFCFFAQFTALKAPPPPPSEPNSRKVPRVGERPSCYGEDRDACIHAREKKKD